MKMFLVVSLFLMINSMYAQVIAENKSFERKGFVFGFGLGAGTLTLSNEDTIHNSFSVALPNIKIGWMLNKQIALMVALPGSTYKYMGKDRGFEGIMIAGQYWFKDKLWLLGGTGLTFDAPAFYTVNKLNSAEFYTGIPAFTFAIGYEIWCKNKFTLDIQYRIFWGRSDLSDNTQRQGFSNMFIIGLNWY